MKRYIWTRPGSSVIKEAGKKADSESFMWVIRSAACEGLQTAFFHYAKSWNGDAAAELLSRFHGYLKYLLTEMPKNH